MLSPDTGSFVTSEDGGVRAMASWQKICVACKSGNHPGDGCCGCVSCALRLGNQAPPLPETLTRDLVEIRGDVKIAIADAAAIIPRGFDGQRRKKEAIDKVDRLLDEYLEALWLELSQVD